MDKTILQFAILLRKAGIQVSHSEVGECLKSLSLVGIEKPLFYFVLLSTLIKDHADYAVFDKVFHYYFQPDFFGHRNQQSRLPGLFAVPDEAAFGCKGNDRDGEDMLGGGEGNRSTGFGRGRRSATASMENLVQVIKLGDVDEMTRMIRQGINSLGKIQEADLDNMNEPIRQVKVFLEWNMGVDRLERESANLEENTRLTWQEHLKKMEEILYREMEKTLINEFGEKALDTVLVRENINELDFFQLSSPQVNEIKKKITKLAHRLSTKLAFRYKRAHRGKVDLARTIKTVVAYGGVPIRLAFRDKCPTRPEFVILCDVSGSVKLFSEFMLQLVYSIQTRFLSVRSFVFVDIPDEATHFLRNREIEDGIREMYNRGKFSMSAFSDYGRVFIEFHNKYFDLISHKTTLLILGDARNNYNQGFAEVFQKLCHQAKRVIWLNPEPQENWDREDNIMSVYGASCTQVFECRNLKQLEVLARRII